MDADIGYLYTFCGNTQCYWIPIKYVSNKIVVTTESIKVTMLSIKLWLHLINFSIFAKFKQIIVIFKSFTATTCTAALV